MFAEDEILDNEEEDLLQFDFEASINAKKKALNANMSSSNLVSMTQQTAQAPQVNPNVITEKINEEFPMDSGDKEKLEVMKKKKEFAFDMFADDDNDFENVNLCFFLSV